MVNGLRRMAPNMSRLRRRPTVKAVSCLFSGAYHLQWVPIFLRLILMCEVGSGALEDDEPFFAKLHSDTPPRRPGLCRTTGN